MTRKKKTEKTPAVTPETVLDYLRQHEPLKDCVWLTVTKIQRITRLGHDAAESLYDDIMSGAECVDRSYHWRGHFISV